MADEETRAPDQSQGAFLEPVTPVLVGLAEQEEQRFGPAVAGFQIGACRGEDLVADGAAVFRRKRSLDPGQRPGPVGRFRG